MKLKLSPGQAITFGPYRVAAVTAARLVAIGIRDQIKIGRRPEGSEVGGAATLQYRESLVFDGVGHLISDAKHEVTVEVMGPVERVKISREPYPKPAKSRQGKHPQG